jgi:hypothetical protein
MFTTPLERLRKALYDAPIPDMIEVPAIGIQPARTLPITKATVDEIAFALVAFEAESTERFRITHALKDVIDLARQQGAVGTDLAIPAAIARKEKRR